MIPLKIFLSPRRWLSPGSPVPDLVPGDPFDNPHIAAMDLRQLADLPFPRGTDAAAAENPPLARCA
jgi:hypothetical protein